MCQECLITLTSLAVCSRPTDGLFLRLISTSGTDNKLRLQQCGALLLASELPEGQGLCLVLLRITLRSPTVCVSQVSSMRGFPDGSVART